MYAQTPCNARSFFFAIVRLQCISYAHDSTARTGASAVIRDGNDIQETRTGTMTHAMIPVLHFGLYVRILRG
jgi:transketolase C-terminal domain/subunit